MAYRARVGVVHHACQLPARLQYGEGQVAVSILIRGMECGEGIKDKVGNLLILELPFTGPEVEIRGLYEQRSMAGKC